MTVRPDLRDAPTWYLDPMAAWHTTPAAIEAASKERARRILAAANDPDRPRRPLTHAELETDSDTKIRGGKSRRAPARERRPVSAAADELGYDRWGHWVPGGEG